MTFGKQNVTALIVSLISISLIVGVFIFEPIAQDPRYHDFADKRSLFNIPNFWNVISNLPFLFVGISGLLTVSNPQYRHIYADIKFAYALFYLGVLLVAFGSGYYHLWPDNVSLVWDRLPMTISFMALFAIIIATFISMPLGKSLLIPLIMVGAFSIYYWHSTESIGAGDLRLYALVQFLPILLIPLILVLYKSKSIGSSGYWWLLCAYVLAKIFEHFDASIYDSLTFISGHSLKHFAAAFGVFLLLQVYRNNKI